MLQQGLELIVQYPTTAGYRCRGFRGIAAPQGVFVVFDGQLPGDQPAAETLGEAFCAELGTWIGISEETRHMPCHGSPAAGCHALGEPACRKLLVAMIDPASAANLAGWPPPWGAAQWPATVPSNNFEVLPVLPIGAAIDPNVPAGWRHLNVAFWRTSPTEVLPDVFQRATLAPEENRVFISYLRKETSALAEQLFTELTKLGFDVFLDRFSVPRGVDFQKQLQQDLSDKGMVVLLNSPGIAGSHWVMEEIATVKRFRLGLFELCLPNAVKRPDVDVDFRHELQANELTGDELTAAALNVVVGKMRLIHDNALHRRRYELADNFARVLMQVGIPARVEGDGTFVLSGRANAGATYFVKLLPRPPALGNFCALHMRHGLSSPNEGRLLSPAPNFLAARQAELGWLGRLSQIVHLDESQMLAFAQQI